MDPLFFGRPERQLFGAYHPPESERARGTGVVLCYPAMQEYMRTHFAFRKLAALLARDGFHVLRFDYSGMGDSAGEPSDASVDVWCSDLVEAAAELKDVAGVRRISVVGMRLGAAIAARAVAERLEVRDLVLWEPAVNGRAHLQELRRIQAHQHSFFRYPPPVGNDEIIGYPLPPALRASIEELDLLSLASCRAERVLLFASEQRPEYVVLGGALRDRSGRAARCEIVAEETGARAEAVMLSTRILQAIANAMREGP
jgi:pimeloyl-ACP methyl ester carboxylesterase